MSANAQTPPKKKPDGRTGVGIVLTVAWLGAAAAYFLLSGDFKDLKPNEYGDFFAGVFSPVAFLWLVLGYAQQGEELQQNTEALRLQHQELAATVMEQRKMVEVARQQLEEDRARYRRIAEEQTRAIQPQLRIVGNLHNEIGGSASWVFVVRSLHNICSGVSLRCSTPPLQTGSIDLLRPERAQELRGTFREAGEMEFQVDYTDAAGNPGTQKFKVTRPAGDRNHLHFEPMSPY